MYDRNLTMNMMEPVLQREEYFGKLEKVFRPFSGYIEDKMCDKPNGLKEKKVILRAVTVTMISTSTSPVNFRCYCQEEIKHM